jgi:hypothetical protein
VVRKGEDVPCPVDDDGRFVDPVTDFAGVYVKVRVLYRLPRCLPVWLCMCRVPVWLACVCRLWLECAVCLAGRVEC